MKRRVLRINGVAVIGLAACVWLHAGCGDKSDDQDNGASGAGGSGADAQGGKAGYAAGTSTDCGDTLSDVDHCGRCNKPCEVGICSEGSCTMPTVLASGQEHPEYIAAHEGQVYWLHSYSEEISAVAATGGQPRVLVARKDKTSIEDFALGGNSIYWITSEAGLSKTVYEVMSQSVDGSGTPVQLYQGSGRASGITVIGDKLYWYQSGTEPSKVYAMPTSGGEPELLAEGLGDVLSTLIVADGIYWADGASLGDDRIVKTPWGVGKEPVVIEYDLTYPRGLVADDTHLYWSCASMVCILRKKPLNGGKTQALSKYNNGNGAIAIDTEFVYFGKKDVSTPNGEVLARVPKNGGDTVNIARVKFMGYSRCPVAVDAERLYWFDSSEGAIYSLKK